MTGISPNALVQRRDDVLANDLSATETVMLDVAEGSYFGLKDVGKAIWDQLEQPIAVSDVCERLGMQFDVDAETCRVETVAFLEHLLEHGLIVVAQ
jgi:hypothetical protein